MRATVSVSVILPAFDRARLLPRSIGSVLAQTAGDLELIVVDDGSTDDTEAVVAGVRDPRVHYVKLPRNRGLPAARNAGLAVARGDVIAFQDSDDEWLPEKLARQLAVLARHPDAGVAYSDMHRVLADGRVFHQRAPRIARGRLVDPETRYWQSYMLAMQPTLVRRACFARHRFDETLIRLEDLDLHLRLAREFGYVHMPEALVRYHESDGLTTDQRAEQRARWQLLRKYRRELVATEPRFLVAETAALLCRRSLMPLVRRHLTPA